MRNIASRLAAITVSATLVGGNSSSSTTPRGPSEAFSTTTGPVDASCAVLCEGSSVDFLLSTVEAIPAIEGGIQVGDEFPVRNMNCEKWELYLLVYLDWIVSREMTEVLEKAGWGCVYM
jgi:hypothetical protein